MWIVQIDIKMTIKLFPAAWQDITADPAGYFSLNFSTSKALGYQTITFLIILRF